LRGETELNKLIRTKILISALFSTLIISNTILFTAPANAASKYPLVITSADFQAKISKKPARIISLSPTATEILFAIGASKQVLAVDDNSNYPLNVPKSQLSGFTPNVEAIVALKPDLVVLQIDSAKSKSVRDSLTKLGIPVVMEKSASKISDTYNEIELLGKVTDRSSAAEILTTSMKKRITKILSASAKMEKYRFFHELDNTLYSATSKTFIGNVYKDFGLTNVANAASSTDSAGYPQLNAEYLIKSNPQIIFLADAQYGETSATVKARQGWQGIDAVINSKIVELPADIPSRWGPRIVDFYEIVARAIK
jgi:iron complex transport system substrate-binding protein